MRTQSTWKWLLAGLGCWALPGLTAMAQTQSDLGQQMAPTGVLRAVINLGNPILARRDAGSTDPVGVYVDLARALAERLKLPLQLMPVNSAARSVQAVSQGQADIGFFVIDPVRGQGIAFSPPYVLIEGSYLVKQDSPLTENAQVDQAPHRVVVGQGSAYDLYLTRELQRAQLVRVPTSPQVVPYFTSSTDDVAAGVRQQLASDAQKFPGLRLLPGRFMVIEQAMGQAASTSPAARDYLAQFVRDMKTSGFVLQSLQRHQIDGASIAP